MLKSKLFLTITALFILASSAIGAQAMSSTSNNNGGSGNNYVQPYTGGAPISKVFYPADGSTITITSTGAVIKQSPGHTPYREGWINPADIGSVFAVSGLATILGTIGHFIFQRFRFLYL